MSSTELRQPSIFEDALRENLTELPVAIQAIHDRREAKILRGKADIARGSSPIANLIANTFGFPGSAKELDVEVRIQRTRDVELWTRHFGAHEMRSIMSRKPDAPKNQITESLGWLSFDINLDTRLGRLYYPIGRARIGGFHLPSFLTPKSDTVEHITADGNFYFSVRIVLPLFGEMVSYSGWLKEVPIEAQ